MHYKSICLYSDNYMFGEVLYDSRDEGESIVKPKKRKNNINIVIKENKYKLISEYDKNSIKLYVYDIENNIKIECPIYFTIKGVYGQDADFYNGYEPYDIYYDEKTNKIIKVFEDISFYSKECYDIYYLTVSNSIEYDLFWIKDKISI